MKSVPPEIDAKLVRVAEKQPQYLPITAAIARRPGDPGESHVIAFRPDGDERAKLADGDDIYIGLLSFGGPMQPVRVIAGKVAAAECYGVDITGDPVPPTAVSDVVELLVGVRMSGQSAELVRLFTEVAQERARQDEKWGGPAHDDSHSMGDWRLYRSKFEERAAEAHAALTRSLDRNRDDKSVRQDLIRGGAILVRHNLLKVAALAIAQIQSIDRVVPGANGRPVVGG